MVPLTVNFLRSQWRFISTAHPLAKGVISYAVLWPTGCLIQQTLEGKNYTNYDWARAARFSLFGALYVAPTLYGWVRLSSSMWPQMSLGVGIIKAAVEQVSYGPFACASFFFGMSLLEMKSVQEAKQEVMEKFAPTFKVGMCIWPILQTINFSMIPEHNRIVFVSVCSLMWTIFLAYMKKVSLEELEQVEAVALQNR